MANIKNYSLNGMDLSDPFGDGLMYLQDAIITDVGVRSRPKLPLYDVAAGQYGSSSSLGDTAAIPRYKSAASGWNTVSEYGGLTDYTIAYPVSGDGATQVGANTSYHIANRPRYSVSRIGNESVWSGTPDCLNIGNSIRHSSSLWAGSVKTTTLNSTTSTRTATTTTVSDIVEFSGAVTGLDANWEKAYIYLSGHPKRPFLVVDYISTTKVRIDTSIDTGAAGQTWCMQPFAWVGCPDGVFYNDADPTVSLNEVSFGCTSGHQSRLFGGLVKSAGNIYSHRVYYSGTTADTNGYHKGIHNWYPNSYFDVATEIGSKIVALVSFGDDLLIFKDKGIARMRGVVANNDPTKFGARIDVLSDSIRCLGPLSVTKTRDGVFLFSPDGAYMVNGSSVSRIDSKVRAWVDDNIDTSVWGSTVPGDTTVSCTLVEESVWVYVGGVTFDSGLYTSRDMFLLYDIDRDAWHVRTLPITHSLLTAFNLSFTGGSTWGWFPRNNTTCYSPIYIRSNFTYNGASPSGMTVPSGIKDFPVFQVLTNGIRGDGPYSGYVRPSMIFVLCSYFSGSVNDNNIIDAIPNYMGTMDTEFDKGHNIYDGTDVTAVDTGSVSYGVTNNVGGTYVNPAWYRFNVGSIPKSVTSNAIIASGDDWSGTYLYVYGVSVDVEYSEVAATSNA